MRKTVTIKVCDAHYAKDNDSEERATQELTIGTASWELCDEHTERFKAQFTDLLGEPRAGEEQ